MYWTTFLLPAKDLLTVKLFVLDKEDSISSVEEGEFKREDPRLSRYCAYEKMGWSTGTAGMQFSRSEMHG